MYKSICFLILCSVGSTALAQQLLALRYDARHDKLVADIAYRGTNADHEFSIEWGECRNRDAAGPPHEIAGRVIDRQWDDIAQQDYTRQVRFDIDALRGCRPVSVTLRTASNFHATVFVPAAGGVE